MAFSRPGDWLWEEWSGFDYHPEPDNLVYCTEGHISLSEESALKALAYALRRDGIFTTLGEAFSALESAHTDHGYRVLYEDSFEDSFASDVDELDDPLALCHEVTLVEVPYAG